MKSTILWIILSVCLFVSGFLFVIIGYGGWKNKIRGYYPTNCIIVGYEDRTIACPPYYNKHTCEDCYVIYSYLQNNNTYNNATVYVGTSVGSCPYSDYPLYYNVPCYYKGNQIIIDNGGWYVTLIIGIALSILSFIVVTFLLLFKLKNREWHRRPIMI